MRTFSVIRQSASIRAIVVASLALAGCGGSTEEASPVSSDAGKTSKDSSNTNTDSAAATVVCGGETCQLPAFDAGTGGAMGGFGLGALGGAIQFCCTPQNTCGFDVSAFAGILPPGLLGDSGSTCFARSS